MDRAFDKFDASLREMIDQFGLDNAGVRRAYMSYHVMLTILRRPTPAWLSAVEKKYR